MHRNANTTIRFTAAIAYHFGLVPEPGSPIHSVERHGFHRLPVNEADAYGHDVAGKLLHGRDVLKTDAPSGQGLYACVAGSWSVVGSGGVDVPFHTILDLQPSISATVLTIAAGRCWGGQKATMTATITGGTGNGSFVVYCNESQAVVVEHSTSAGLTVSCANCVPAQLAMPSIPEGLYPIATGTISSGQWSAVTDLRDFSVRARHTNGIGMNVQCSGGTCVHQVDSAIVQTKADPYTPLGTFDASSATITKPVRTGTSVPGTCTVGDQFFKTDAAAGQNLMVVRQATFGRCWGRPRWQFIPSGFRPDPAPIPIHRRRKWGAGGNRRTGCRRPRVPVRRRQPGRRRR